MYKKSKKILVNTELREKVTLRKTSIRFTRSNCEICGDDSEMLMLDSAVTVSGLSTLEILVLIKASGIHCTETPNGHLVVCRRSLEANSPKQFMELKEAINQPTRELTEYLSNQDFVNKAIN
jgi:hypothetical protein